MKIIDKNIAEQTRGIFRATSVIPAKAGIHDDTSKANEWRDIPSDEGSKQVLSDEDILELSELILKIEQHYGFPCDIEWAREGGKFYIVQSRPITTLSEEVAQKRNVYALSYTRDRQIITQHAWYHGNTEGLARILGIESDHSVPIVFYVRDGAVEIWEQPTYVYTLTELVSETNKSNPDLFGQVFTEFLDKLDLYFNTVWAQEQTTDVEELKHVADTFVEFTAHYVYMWYSMLSETVPEEYTERLHAWREKDAYFENTGEYIERSITKIYPRLAKYARVLTVVDLNDPPTVKQLDERVKHFVSVPGSVSFTGSLDEFEQKNVEYRFLQERDVSVESGRDRIEGQVAYKGKVLGKVHIVRNREQAAAVTEGEVIVSPMTIPEFLSAMKHAVAFVTDEGGITCHAAIVSRELKKPCIIGTKIATQVLKDGDLVEVDAEKGVVRVLENSSKGDVLDSFKNDEWEIMKTPAAPLVFSYNAPAWVEGSVKRYGEIAPLKRYVGVARNGGETTTLAVHRGDYISSAKYLWEHKEKLEAIFLDFDADNAEFCRYENQLATGEKKIRESFDEFLKRYRRMYSSGIMFDGFLFYSDILVDQIKSKYNTSLHETIDTLLHMPALSFAQEEELSLWRIAIAGVDQQNELLKAHQKKYHWVLNNYLKTESLPVQYFEDRLCAISGDEARNKIAELASCAEEYTSAVKKIRSDGLINVQDITSLQLLGKISYGMDKRKASNLLGNHWIGQYIHAQCEYLKIKYEDALLLLDHEFDALVGGAHAPDVTSRRKLFGFACDGANKQFCASSDCQKFEDFLSVTHNATDSVSGTAAFKGIIRGRVKVLEHSNEKKFEDDEILVTSMTRPDFVPLMKRAKAIITDEGGITCHAAIVSRELKKPCIIGTKIATQVLKDGDLVEVDAEKGVVRIIERSASG